MSSRRPIGIALATMALLALLATSLRGVGESSAVFTTASQSRLEATAERASAWLRVYSQTTDPDGLGGYALRRVQIPPGPPAAAGMDEGLTVDLGGFPDSNTTFTFNRVFTIKTPAAFPDLGVPQVTVTVSLAPDQTTGEQPLRTARLNTVGAAGGAVTVTIGPNQKRQFNVQVRARTRFQLGRTYYPHVILTVAWAGGPANYYVYDYPVAVTDAGF
jgi:hypothetical protein